MRASWCQQARISAWKSGLMFTRDRKAATSEALPILLLCFVLILARAALKDVHYDGMVGFEPQQAKVTMLDLGSKVRRALARLRRRGAGRYALHSRPILRRAPRSTLESRPSTQGVPRTCFATSLPCVRPSPRRPSPPSP